MAEYTFFKLEKEHYSRIQDLYKRSFGMNKTFEEIEKKNYLYLIFKIILIYNLNFDISFKLIHR